ncbi:unnamed protein product [Owenia fusiformis]|uniref:SCO-spondin n=1 Tax=Owenia fusiformis TaxID=6347 RepID=A0A8S4MYB4_OWEFU|nr:unnamed protein product [Owenia fusiformis]
MDSKICLILFYGLSIVAGNRDLTLEYKWDVNENSTEPSTGHYTGSVILKQSTCYLLSQCARQCHTEPRCHSYSYNTQENLCELNLPGEADLFEITETFIHYPKDYLTIDVEALGICASAPCSNDAYCIDTNGMNNSRSFICICGEGFIGETCEIEAPKPVWEEWSDWTSCSVTCETGYQQRSRGCVDAETGEGRSPLDCYGADVEYQVCTLSKCPYWEPWSAWDECSSHTTCGRGLKSRSRACMYGGTIGVDRLCMGPNEETSPCHVSACDGAVVLADGAQYGEGIVRLYDTLQHTWTHICADSSWDIQDADIVCKQRGLVGAAEVYSVEGNMPFVFGEVACNGDEVSIQECRHSGWDVFTKCQTGAAAVRCIVNGDWNIWGDWSECSVTCADGERLRHRVCDHPPALHGGEVCQSEAVQSKPCSLPPCPVDGVWEPWSSWGSCDLSCGGGVQWRDRSCLGPFYGGKSCEGPSNDSRDCNTQHCPVDGVYAAWSEWDTCSLTCGGGSQSRYRSCTGPFYGGAECEGPEKETQDCNTHNCPVDGVYSTWSEWNTCNVTCAGGQQSRYRTCDGPYFEGDDCQGPDLEYRDCNTHFCPVDGVYEEWSSWSLCNVTCAGGMRGRSRTCVGPFYGGADCIGPDIEKQECNTHFCPVDGVWGEWSDWDMCSVTCAGGFQTRVRECQGPYYGGAECPGPSNETQACNKHYCPVDGVWLSWTGWSLCSLTCASGQQERTRVCEGPFYGGANCTGLALETQYCNTYDCPVDGSWKEWSDWFPCNVTCGGGRQLRVRDCQDAQHGGEECSGLARQYQDCNIHFCPIDGMWEEWSVWDSCTTSCGGGTQNRTRVCSGPFYGGIECPATASEQRVCNSHHCPVDGVYESWSNWTMCDVTCGGGNQERTRECIGPFYGGAECGAPSKESRTCNEHNCPVDGVFSNWTEWNQCNVTCGGGTQLRTRVCVGPFYGGADCLGPREERQDCNTHFCPVDGVYSTWSTWGECDVSCGGGDHYRTRDCTGPYYGGLNCSGAPIEQQPCNTHHCPVDGVYSTWTVWGECSVTCGGGNHSRDRQCIGPFYGGLDCQEPLNQTQDCNTQFCPVDGVWTDWGEWGSCNVSCGGGSKLRHRQCIPPQYGGADCIGGPAGATDMTTCSTEPCPVDGDWSLWSGWSDCNTTCGGGKRQKYRFCTESQHGGNDCEGPDTLFESCNEHNCPVDGVLMTWSPWSDCSLTCGGGVQNRSRECHGPFYNGQDCNETLSDSQACNTRSCPVDGEYSSWEQWSDCTTSCGGGTRLRDRQCGGAAHGGKPCEGESVETEVCNTHHCPIDGVFTTWAAWMDCSLSCGGGEQSRFRDCIGPFYGGLDCIGPANQSQACNEHNCPIDGVFSIWTEWDTCDVSCAGGLQRRHRECIGPFYGGLECEGDHNQTQECNMWPCPVDGAYETWVSWSNCNVTCGGGSRKRTRNCFGPFYGGANCSGDDTEIEGCNDMFCPVDGVHEEWTEWGKCSVTCAGGTRTRSRTCNGPYYGGADCPEPMVETQDCNVYDCPVDGTFSPWTAWDACSVSCGGGIHGRTRQCNNVAHGGKDCVGDLEEVEPCNTHNCPVDGIFETWTEWNQCNVTCGGGTQLRTRVCLGPFYDGEDCVGAREEKQDCNTHFCPVNGVVTQWEEWSRCSLTCGGGGQSRIRTCYGPFYNGANCTDPLDETRSCNIHNCPVDGIYADWEQWGDCSLSCGGGAKQRERSCLGPFYDGKPCEGDSQETADCNTHHCPVDGVYNTWGLWSECSVTCGGGIRTRNRTCDGPYYNGEECHGPDTQTEICGTETCLISGLWLSWETWSPCSTTCGGGSRSRERHCNTTSFGDRTKECEGNSTETQDCHTYDCEPYARTCSELMERGLLESRLAEVDPDGEESSYGPIFVYCDLEMMDGVGVMVLHHNQEEKMEVQGYEGPGEYEQDLDYGLEMSDVIALVDRSEYCRQYVKWECYNAAITSPYDVESKNTFWSNRKNIQKYYWGGADVDSKACACYMNESCARSTELPDPPPTVCNCDANDNVWRSDEGYIEHKKDLPVHTIFAGETGELPEKGNISVGPLECHGTNNDSLSHPENSDELDWDYGYSYY